MKDSFRSFQTTFVVTGAMLAFAAPSRAQGNGLDPEWAQTYFLEARRICSGDSGQLWGKSLCGPMLLVDPRTRAMAANQADGEARLKPQAGIFVGKLPADVNVANMALTWAGVKWTMIQWPLPESPTARARLMMHELFHRMQDDLGLPASNPANAHLDSLEGRLWLQLEWRALRQALARPAATPAERSRAIRDALLFRRQRRAVFPAAAADERGLEMNEGLAEYTGYKLRGTSLAATAEAVIARLGDAADESSYVRSFAYASGPAYGLLLDLAGTQWRRGLTPASDLGDLTGRGYGVELPADAAAEARGRAADYDGEALRFRETQRDQARKQAVAAYRKRLVEGPVLLLPVLASFNFSFDPNTVVPIDETRTAYPTLRVTDEWGILEVTDGALLVRDAGRIVRVVVEAPSTTAASGHLEGNGWKLELAPGWKLVGAERRGDSRVSRE
jgi:hypothetical protein